MKEQKRIAFIGAGNLAWQLAPALENAGYPVKEVYSRTPENAKKFADKMYECRIHSSLDFSDSPCELFFLSVSDQVLEEIAREIILPDPAMCVHCSGTQPLSILGYLSTEHTGVFYPLQTFSKGKNISFENIPILIESCTEELDAVLREIAGSISKKVSRLNTADRKILHLAAVFASNFTNHLFKISEEILENRGLEFEILQPLILETLNKAIALGPAESQTGPARRNDINIIQQHLQQLSDRDDLADIYLQLSEHIINSYSPPPT